MPVDERSGWWRASRANRAKVGGKVCNSLGGSDECLPEDVLGSQEL